ncbi:MAG: hypothetical protein JXR22_06185, partial [Prolixibacteraceae bacterium]|nr:hypothetical protein [Prolixibacteraceae bacterium]
MKYLVFACLSILMVACGQKSNQTFSVQKIIETNQEKYWNEQSISGSFPSTEKVNPVKVEILIDQPMQTIDGFGGCFNEMGWEVLQTLGKDEREKVFASLFDMETGCRFSIYRIPIGANDYSVDWYSHNETPGDFLMENFSIERDQQRLIPYIKKAMEYHPELKIFASPWCPPLWMKTNGHYACRSDKRVNDLPEEKQGEEMVDQFIMEDRYLDAYALYFSKFVSAYKNEG